MPADEKWLALNYLQTHRPSILTLEDLSLQLTVFLASKMTSAALNHQRSHRQMAHQRQQQQKQQQQAGDDLSGSLPDLFRQCHDHGWCFGLYILSVHILKYITLMSRHFMYSCFEIYYDEA